MNHNEKGCALRGFIDQCEKDMNAVQDAANVHTVNNLRHTLRLLDCGNDNEMCKGIDACKYYNSNVNHVLAIWSRIKLLFMKKFNIKG